ncbi:hypothetical protein FACS1894199_03740 [Bacteroidia bacterium]|nr:hypothetical protein FACS1894199_03740 [Bacteroidia bacterium]
MAKYLDPTNDVIFKRVFGEHPKILISFLNALLPLQKGHFIESLEYLPNEQVPDNPLKKLSFVDVHCKDNFGRQFIVEMQNDWYNDFLSRMLFNTSKAYVRQLEKGAHFAELKPVYGLGILGSDYDKETDEFYHHYQIINSHNSNETIEGLEFILVELNKFKPEKMVDRKMAVLWLRFLREVNEKAKEIPPEFLDDIDIQAALTVCEHAGLTDDELRAYENEWLRIASEWSFINEKETNALKKGEAEGEAKGEARGIKKGLKKGREKGREKGRKEGREKGLAEGLAEGREEGREEGLAERQQLEEMLKAAQAEIAEKEAALAKIRAT